MSATVKVEGVRELAAEFELAKAKTLPEVAAVVVKGGVNIKKDWASAWKGLKHVRVLPYAIGFDVTTAVGSISAEIGPDKDKRQGPLANLIEFGSLNNPPHPGGGPALDKEAPRFEKALYDVTVKVLP